MGSESFRALWRLGKRILSLGSKMTGGEEGIVMIKFSKGVFFFCYFSHLSFLKS